MKNKLKKLTALCSVALMIFGILNTLSVSAPPLTVIISGIGAMAGDNFGWNVSYAGDLNGDGYDDFIMGAPYNDSEDGSKSECGAVYIFFGYDCITTSNLDALNANVTIYGATAGDHFGWSVSNGGNI
ncbi:MAG: integrin alpha, partial [Candidatus Thermoplasmatota archaeon]